MTYEQEEHERDLYEEARAEQQHAVAYTERENANLLRTVERLEQENRDLVAALGVLLDQVDYTEGNCRVNEMVGAVLPEIVIDTARQALAQVGGE